MERTFPNVPYSRRRRWSAATEGRDDRAQYSNAEIDSVRRDLLTRGTGIDCPRCHSRLESGQPTRPSETGALVWRARCTSCSRHLSLRIVPPGATPPPDFDGLVWSNPRERRYVRAPGWAVSVGMHALFIALAVLATRPAADAAAHEATDTTMVLLASQVLMRAPPPERSPAVVHSVSNLPAPPKGFKTIVAPVDVPVAIPPVDLAERFDPRDFSGVGVEGGTFDGLTGGIDPSATGDIIPEHLADEPPERLSGPRLKYPELLRQGGIEGFVVVGFIVDTAGRAEPESITVLGTTEVGFNFAATDLVRRSRYRPGRVRGKPVRTRATLRVEFSLVEPGE